MIGRIVGSYEIVERLGEGGMGTVFRAVDRMLEREVALKVIRPELASEPEAAERFRAEARAIARVNHPAIATIYSFLAEGSELFLALELVRGRTLAQVLREEGPLPWQRAVPLFSAALDGIEHVHRLGIVHRDLKPDNLMLTEAGGVKVMDFGIARVAGSGRLTRTGLVIGTLRYMAPEQIRGEEPDRRTDVYALGIMLYELLTGRVPFTGATDFAVLKAQLEEAPKPPAELVPDLPGWLERAVLRALAKDPAERFQTAEELRAELQRDTRATHRPELGPAVPAVPAVAAVAAAVTLPGSAATAASATRPTVLRPGGPTPSRPVPAPPDASGAAAGTNAQGTYRGYGLGAGPGRRLWLAGAAAALLAAAGIAVWSARPDTDAPPAEVQAALGSLPLGTEPGVAPTPDGAAAGLIENGATAVPSPVAAQAQPPQPTPQPRITPPPSQRPATSTPVPLPTPEPAPQEEIPAPVQETAPGPTGETEEVEPADGPTGPARLVNEIVDGTPRLAEAYEAFLERKEDGGAELTPADERLREELEAFLEAAERVRNHLRDGFIARTRHRLRRADEPARRAELLKRLEALRASVGRVDRLMSEVQPDGDVPQLWQDLRRRGQRLTEQIGR
jgi:eukaryotic-like serine/threonine-protein kinase